jgi:hypothetical protein
LDWTAFSEFRRRGDKCGKAHTFAAIFVLTSDKNQSFIMHHKSASRTRIYLQSLSFKAYNLVDVVEKSKNRSMVKNYHRIHPGDTIQQFVGS